MAIRNIQRNASRPGAYVGSAKAAPIYCDSDDSILKFIPGGEGATTEVQVIDAATTQTITGTKTFTSPVLSTASLTSPTITGNSGSGTIFSKTVLFTEDATSTTHTGTVTIPAGATLLDILVIPQVLWGDSDAALVVGDANSANGWFTTTQLDTTDLVIGERLQASNANNWGGVNGAYLTTAGRFGQQSGNMIGGYCPTAYSVIGVVSVASPSATAGRTRMTVLWTVGETVAPVLA